MKRAFHITVVLSTLLHLQAACAPVVMPAGAAVAESALSGDSIATADGARLPLKSWLPRAGQPQAVIIALHGFNDYSNFFNSAGSHFAEHGVASYAYDQRGFGGAPHRGVWPGEATLADDLRQAARVIAGRHPGRPLFILGESMGGAVAMLAAAGREPPIADGLILAAPAVWGRASIPWYQNVALWIAAHTFPEGRLSGRGLGIRASDNTPMLQALGRDPMVIKETRIDAVFGLVGLMDAAMAAARSLDRPTLVLWGRNDQLIPEGVVRELLANLPEGTAKSSRVVFYHKGWHMLLRDLQAEIVYRDILSWLKKPAQGLPSGEDQPATAKAERG
jgi:alpha-beta hydrolase superfamily lysophospholipase